jgi:hypothetical protein
LCFVQLSGVFVRFRAAGVAQRRLTQLSTCTDSSNLPVFQRRQQSFNSTRVVGSQSSAHLPESAGRAAPAASFAAGQAHAERKHEADAADLNRAQPRQARLLALTPRCSCVLPGDRRLLATRKPHS